DQRTVRQPSFTRKGNSAPRRFSCSGVRRILSAISSVVSKRSSGSTLAGAVAAAKMVSAALAITPHSLLPQKSPQSFFAARSVPPSSKRRRFFRNRYLAFNQMRVVHAEQIAAAMYGIHSRSNRTPEPLLQRKAIRVDPRFVVQPEQRGAVVAPAGVCGLLGVANPDALALGIFCRQSNEQRLHIGLDATRAAAATPREAVPFQFCRALFDDRPCFSHDS